MCAAKKIYLYLYVNLRMPVEPSEFLGAAGGRWLGRPASKTPLFTAPQPLGARNGRSSPLGAAGALEMAARARSEPQWRSKWPLEPASDPLGRSKSLLEPASEPLGRSKWPFEPRRLRWGARIGCSGLLGLAGALELTAQARSALLGRAKSLLRPARARWGAQIGCSS